MSRKIILIGAMSDQIPKGVLLSRLKSEVSDSDEWAWIDTSPLESFQPHHVAVSRLLDELRKWRSTKAASGGQEQVPRELVVVKLPHLHGRTSNQLFAAWPDPKLAPYDTEKAEELIRWLRSADADLYPPRDWHAGEVEAALVAILCKLLRNKSWNANVQGHAWTKEEDLLTQSPVVRDDRPRVAIEARRLLSTLDGKLLLTKGSGQGKTPAEWSIDTKYLSAVKKSIVAKSLDPLRVFPELIGLLDRVAGEVKQHQLDGEIVSERVIYVCRERIVDDT